MSDFTLRTDTAGVPVAAYNEEEDLLRMTSMQKKWRSDFVGSSLNTAKWELLSLGAGMTESVSGGTLTVTSGLTANSEYSILSKEIFTISIRALIQFYISAKNANTEVWAELVSVDPLTGIPDGQHSAGWLIDNGSATSDYAKYSVQFAAQAPLISAAIDTNVSTFATGIREIELFPDEAWFHSRAVDSTAGRTTSFVRSQQIPEPNAFYKVRLRVKNLSTAPTVSTTVYFQGVTVVDFAELTTEITAGRGVIAAGQATAVYVTNTVSNSSAGTHDSSTMPSATIMGAYAHATGQATVSADGDVTRLRADRFGTLSVFNPPIGAQANTWNATAASAGGTSTSIDTNYCQTISIFGTSSVTSTLTVQFSQDNTNFYDSEITISATAGVTFGISKEIGARYIRLKTSAASTITATIAGKS